ncbi:DMT family transporter [Oceanobacter mangrovi]|uniref:DMT family transporter n=1 Tax=Oceanobacter mangrovi TaxID=2862510 RepID=UPI001C8CFC32|nr:DMT family transporter [Oceanobacter mangrovi]
MWILATLFAAACQSVRTAHQKNLSQHAGFLHATMARSLFGLPLVSLYLAGLWWTIGATTLPTTTAADYSGWVMACAVSQILATWLMLRVFQSGSFMLGSMLAKTEAVMAAVIAIPLLHHELTTLAWCGVILGVLGAMTMGIKASGLKNLWRDASLWPGLASGLCFAITAVSASKASHTLDGPVLVNAAMTLWLVLLIQSIILCSLQIRQQRDWLAPIRQQRPLSIKVGVLSSMGSIGWFTGFALVNPALVKTLGQIEVLGTLYFSKKRFAEHISRQQWLGGTMILASVLMVTLERL